MPTVTVIVPTRSRNHLLPRCLASLAGQTFTDFEVVLVDDNEPESRVRLEPGLQDWLQKPWLRLVESTSSRNAACARNAGLRQARGEWITFLDDDDAYRPEKLMKQMQAAQASQLPMGLCGFCYHLPSRLRVLRRNEDVITGEDLLLYFPGLPAILHRRAEPIEFHPELRAGEDAHYYQQLLAHFGSDRVFNVPQALIDVYPQPDARVNLNAQGQNAAAEMIVSEFAHRYQPDTVEVFRLRSSIGQWKLVPGHVLPMITAVRRLLRLRGTKDVRFIVNALLFKIPFLRRLLVS